MTKPLKNYTVAFAFAASLLGLIPFPATADQSTAILQMRTDGPDVERMGSKDSYPSCIEAITRMSCRVGTWSGKHCVQRSVPVHVAEVPSALGSHPSPPPVAWSWGLFSHL
ncbi:MAG: hypothetical protein EB017_03195 [Betaproteobacteria bacterium]|nr:hypothetical protein [Betaproteobacteria bacterium]